MNEENNTRFFVFDSDDKNIATVNVCQDIGKINVIVEMDQKQVASMSFDYGFASVSKNINEIQKPIIKNIDQIKDIDAKCIKMSISGGLADVEKSLWYREGLESHIRKHGKKYLILDMEKFNGLQVVNEDVQVIPINETTFTCTNEDFIKIGIKKCIFREVETVTTGKTITSVEDLFFSITKMETKDGTPMLYYVYIGDRKICFTPAELLNIGKWREKLLEHCKIVMGLRGKSVRNDFDNMVARLLESSVSIWTDEESEEEMYASIIMEDIEKLILVDNGDSFKRNDMSYMLGDDDSLYVKSSTIHQIIKNRNIGISLSKTREVLRPYLTSNTKQIRVDGKKISIWFFRQRK